MPAGLLRLLVQVLTARLFWNVVRSVPLAGVRWSWVAYGAIALALAAVVILYVRSPVALTLAGIVLIGILFWRLRSGADPEDPR